MALYLYAACAWVSRPQCAAGPPAGSASGDQHAFGEEPVPDAHEEHDRRPLPSQLGVHHGARSGGTWRVRVARAEFTEGLLVCREELEARADETARDHETQTRDRRLYRRLGPPSSGAP